MWHKIIDEFLRFTTLSWAPSSVQLEELKHLCAFAEAHGYKPSRRPISIICEAINQKLNVSAERYQKILDLAFAKGIKLNYIAKSQLHDALDQGDVKSLLAIASELNFNSKEIKDIGVPSVEETGAALQCVLNYDNDKGSEILGSIFSRYCYRMFEPECTFQYFSGTSATSVPTYNDFLERKYPGITSRDAALAIINVDNDILNDYDCYMGRLLMTIKSLFSEMNNHTVLAVFIPPLKVGSTDIQWTAYKDIVLYAEKFEVEELTLKYFRWKEIEHQTSSYTGDTSQAHEYSKVNQGFVYKDCFVYDYDKSRPAYSLLLIFEKNVRDERPINCPACWSTNVQGNSYPILNVRSWECENPLCCERSKYNRGNRYSFCQLQRQGFMGDENIIPNESIMGWHLDIASNMSKDDAYDMVMRHYSCVGDKIIVYGKCSDSPKRLWNRRIERRNIADAKIDNSLLKTFLASDYFKRFLVAAPKCTNLEFESSTIGHATIVNGDSLHVLATLKTSTLDAAVTSPPYYNAKEYSHWPNIYCYLFDMYNISREVYRVLKPGSVYLFNIFDYFDNENNVVFSAMGKKRMILGAYMLDIFSRIGFQICGNIVWYKGEIQGNRSFNQGNLTPYYQAPLNCWEHVFVLSKGAPNKKFSGLVSSIRHIRPVTKMVRGKNVLGHTAPFPEDIPYLIIKHLTPEDTVLDPFLGSGTTCIVANLHGVNSIGVERDATYFSLATRRVGTQSISLF